MKIKPVRINLNKHVKCNIQDRVFVFIQIGYYHDFNMSQSVGKEFIMSKNNEK
jgi:hypothetical protein